MQRGATSSEQQRRTDNADASGELRKNDADFADRSAAESSSNRGLNVGPSGQLGKGFAALAGEQKRAEHDDENDTKTGDSTLRRKRNRVRLRDVEGKQGEEGKVLCLGGDDTHELTPSLFRRNAQMSILSLWRRRVP